MESRLKVLGHPLHPLLIVFPIGTLVPSVILDVTFWVTGNPNWLHWSWGFLVAGVIGGWIAAVAGAVDWFAIPMGTRAKMVGMIHGGTNLAALLLFSVSLVMRGFSGSNETSTEGPAHIGLSGATNVSTAAIALSILAGGMLLFGGWLGAELVYRLGVGVDPGAHLDSRNSLATRDAHQTVESKRQMERDFPGRATGTVASDLPGPTHGRRTVEDEQANPSKDFSER
jgi:uncharacterized membrane protein